MAETHPGGGDRGGCLRGGGWGGEATLKTLTPSVKELKIFAKTKFFKNLEIAEFDFPLRSFFFLNYWPFVFLVLDQSLKSI